jgi:choline-glycine betaine transporter
MAGGKVDAPLPQRVFRCTSEYAVAIVLLVGGSLGVLQSMVVSTGLPFILVLLLMCRLIFQGLRSDVRWNLRLLGETGVARFGLWRFFAQVNLLALPCRLTLSK